MIIVGKGWLVVNIGVADSLMAKLWGVCKGLLLAKNLGLSQFVVELDAIVVVKFLKIGVSHTHPWCWFIMLLFNKGRLGKGY